MNPTRTQAIKEFLTKLSPEQSKDLAALYSSEMECQVNVAKDDGEAVQGEYNGKIWKGWSDGAQTWKNFAFHTAQRKTRITKISRCRSTLSSTLKASA